MAAIGENIRKLREDRRWTQADLAQMTGLGEKYISAIETGGRDAGKKVIVKMCEAFAVDELTIRFGERQEPEEEKPQVPEHLKLLFEEIYNLFPTPTDLVLKSDKLARVMREVRDEKR